MRKIVERSMLGKAWVCATEYEENTPSSTILKEDLLKKILESRGVRSGVDTSKFLNPSIKEYMPDPSVLADMDSAARIIVDNIVAGRKIAIYGDYDVDGITSSAIMVKYLRAVGANVVWHLPTREGEGYGLNCDAVSAIAADGVNLIVTVDCGISGVEEIALAKKLGLDVVVTDHHSPDGNLPAADAVVNPKRLDDTSGMSYLAGVGVAFMTLVAVNRELKSRNDDKFQIPHSLFLIDLMDLVALGTICDTMPLVGLNRAFAATGLKVLAKRNNVGLRALMDIAVIKKPTTYSVMFALGPRLNAAGRLDSAAPALELLLTDNILVANDLAAKLNRMNQERIDVQNAIMISATEMAQKCCALGKCSLFVCGDNWRTGVMGIIAGRLKDKYNLPTCVATKCDGVIDGSGRSIPGVDLGRIVHDAAALGIISGGGGHAAAAGFTLPAENEQKFCEFLEKSVLAQLDGKIPENETVVDAEMDAGGATMKLVEQLAELEPFGQANPEPTLVLRGGTLAHATIMGKGGTHLRGYINTGNGSRLAFVGFNMVGTPVGDFLLDDAHTNTKMMMLGKLKENEYQGRVSAQFILEDLAI